MRNEELKMTTLTNSIKQHIPYFRYNRYGCWSIRISPRRHPDIDPLTAEEIKIIDNLLNKLAIWYTYAIEYKDDDPHTKHMHAVFRYKSEPKRRQVKDILRQFECIWVNRDPDEYILKESIKPRRMKDIHDLAASGIGYTHKESKEIGGNVPPNIIADCREFYEYVKKNRIQPTRKRKRGKIINPQNFAAKMFEHHPYENLSDVLIQLRDEDYEFRFMSPKENYAYVRSNFSDEYLISWARKHGYQKTKKQLVLEELKEMCTPGTRGYYFCITKARDTHERKHGNLYTTKHQINKDPYKWLERCKDYKKNFPDRFAAPMSK